MSQGSVLTLDLVYYVLAGFKSLWQKEKRKLSVYLNSRDTLVVGDKVQRRLPAILESSRSLHSIVQGGSLIGLAGCGIWLFRAVIFGHWAEKGVGKGEFQLLVGAGFCVFIGLECEIGKGNRAGYGISITPWLHHKRTNAKPQASENAPFVRTLKETVGYVNFLNLICSWIFRPCKSFYCQWYTCIPGLYLVNSVWSDVTFMPSALCCDCCFWSTWSGLANRSD